MQEVEQIGLATTLVLTFLTGGVFFSIVIVLFFFVKTIIEDAKNDDKIVTFEKESTTKVVESKYNQKNINNINTGLDDLRKKIRHEINNGSK